MIESWEEIHSTDNGPKMPNVVTERTSVPGGWLVRIIHVDYQGCLFGVGGLTFVPDAEHVW